jgi:hypothetical protein
MVTPISLLMSCVGRLTPERKALVERVYLDARSMGKGDGESAAMALALLTDAEKVPLSAHPLDVLRKPVRPPPRATG